MCTNTRASSWLWAIVARIDTRLCPGPSQSEAAVPSVKCSARDKASYPGRALVGLSLRLVLAAEIERLALVCHFNAESKLPASA